MSKPGSIRVPGRTQGDAVHARKVWHRPRAEAASLAAVAPDNQAIALVLRGPLDVPRLTAALADLPLRYPLLRRRTLAVVTAEENGATPRLPVTFTDLSASDEAQPSIFSLAREHLGYDTGFADRSQPLARASLVRLAPERHLLCVVAAASTCDPATLGVLLRDLGRCYSARLRNEQPPAPLPVRAPDPALAVQRQEQQQHKQHKQQQKPPDAVLPFRIPEALAVSVARLAARLRAGELTVYLAAYALLLARMTGSSSIPVVVDRADLAAAVLPMLRAMHGEASPSCIAIDTRIPGERLVKEMQALARSLAVPCRPADAVEHPVAELAAATPTVGFRCGVRLTRETIEFDGLAMETVPVATAQASAGFELALAYDGQGLAGEWRYDQQPFDAATIGGWIACYRTLLRSLAVESDSPLALLELLPDDQLQVMTGWNATAGQGPAPSVQERVALAAGRAPDRIALRQGTASITWHKLETQSNRLARHLLARGAGPGMRVGVLMHQGIDRVIAQHAVLKTGAACLPLDPRLPDETLRPLLQADVVGLVVAAALAGDRPPVPLVLPEQEAGDIDGQPGDALAPSASVASGEEPLFVVRQEVDGAGQLVVLPRRAVASAACCLGDIMDLGEDDMLLADDPLQNGGFGLDVLAALASGAQVRFVDLRPSPHALRRLLEEGEVTAMAARSDVWLALVGGGWQGRPGFKAMLPATEASPGLVAALLARGVHVCCFHGTLESAGVAAARKIDGPAQLALPGDGDGATRIIGKPEGVSAVWVCDEHGQPCPIGVAGELHVGGECVASGYLGERPLTAQRFVPDSLGMKTGRKLFRTGEIGRWRHDGLLEYIGRCKLPAMASAADAGADREALAAVSPPAAVAMPGTSRGVGTVPPAPAPVSAVPTAQVAPIASAIALDLPEAVEQPLYALDRSDGLLQEPPILAPDDPVMRSAWQQDKPQAGRREGREARPAASRRAMTMHYVVAVAAGLVVGLALTLVINGERLLEMVFVAGLESIIGGESEEAKSSRPAEATADAATARPIVELPNPLRIREVTSLVDDGAQPRPAGGVVEPAKIVEPAKVAERAKVAEPKTAAEPARAAEVIGPAEASKPLEASRTAASRSAAAEPAFDVATVPVLPKPIDGSGSAGVSKSIDASTTPVAPRTAEAGAVDPASVGRVVEAGSGTAAAAVATAAATPAAANEPVIVAVPVVASPPVVAPPPVLAPPLVVAPSPGVAAPVASRSTATTIPPPVQVAEPADESPSTEAPPAATARTAAAECRRELVVLGLCGKLP